MKRISTHPRLARIAEGTFVARYRDADVRDALLCAGDVRGPVVRVRVTTDPADAPGDQEE